MNNKFKDYFKYIDLVNLFFDKKFGNITFFATKFAGRIYFKESLMIFALATPTTLAKSSFSALIMLFSVLNFLKSI